MSWLSKHGGEVKNPKTDLVSQLSCLGAGGKFPANAERDMHRKMRSENRTIKAKIDFKQVRLTDPSTGEVSWQSFPILLPHELLKALWARGEDTFRKCIFGDMTETAVGDYWQHMENVSPWFQNHPLRRYRCRSRLAAIAPYGDEVQCYRNSEAGIISVCGWSSEFCWKAPPLMRYYALALWSEHHESPFTYTDVIAHFIASMKKLSDPNEVFPWTHKGYLFLMSGIQGDLKWLNERMQGIHNYRQNEFCSRCKCCKSHPDVYKTLPNFSYNEGDHEARDYTNVDLGQLFSPLFDMPGMTIECVLHDMMHSQYLGTGKLVNGPVLTKRYVKKYFLQVVVTYSLARV